MRKTTSSALLWSVPICNPRLTYAIASLRALGSSSLPERALCYRGAEKPPSWPRSFKRSLTGLIRGQFHGSESPSYTKTRRTLPSCIERGDRAGIPPAGYDGARARSARRQAHIGGFMAPEDLNSAKNQGSRSYENPKIRVIRPKLDYSVTTTISSSSPKAKTSKGEL
jgi:hypothetical protein